MLNSLASQVLTRIVAWWRCSTPVVRKAARVAELTLMLCIEGLVAACGEAVPTGAVAGSLPSTGTS